MTATEADIKRQYRLKSVMIHPDKFKHENGDAVSSHIFLTSAIFFVQAMLTDAFHGVV